MDGGASAPWADLLGSRLVTGLVTFSESTAFFWEKFQPVSKVGRGQYTEPCEETEGHMNTDCRLESRLITRGKLPRWHPEASACLGPDSALWAMRFQCQQVLVGGPSTACPCALALSTHPWGLAHPSG